MKENSDKDKLYSKPLDKIEDFKFDENVAGVFDDMIHRSVPGYDTIISMIGVLAERYVQRGTHFYDLGCSLATVTHTVRSHLPHQDCRMIAVDNSPAMVERCKKRLTPDPSLAPVELHCSDVREINIDNASFVVLNFVLQFLSPEERFSVLEKIYQGLNPGGVFVLSEKITFGNDDEERFQIDMHHEFKKLNGYSELEISQKRTALDNILIPDSQTLHNQRLLEIGFREVYTWFQCFNFVSIVAFK